MDIFCLWVVMCWLCLRIYTLDPWAVTPVKAWEESRDGWVFSTVSSNSPTSRQPAGTGRDQEVNSPGTDGGRQALTFQRCPLASWRESPSGPFLDSPRCYCCKCRLKGRRWSWHCRLEAPSGGLWGQHRVVNSCQCEELLGLLWSLPSSPRRQHYHINYLKNDRQLTSPLIWESQVQLAKYSAKRREPDLDHFWILPPALSFDHISFSVTEVLSESTAHGNTPVDHWTAKNIHRDYFFRCPKSEWHPEVSIFLSGAWILSVDTPSFLSQVAERPSQTQVGGEKLTEFPHLGALMLTECQYSHQQQHSIPVQRAFLSRDHANKTYEEKGE